MTLKDFYKQALSIIRGKYKEDPNEVLTVQCICINNELSFHIHYTSRFVDVKSKITKSAETAIKSLKDEVDIYSKRYPNYEIDIAL